ncbi:transcriptional regulator, MarR family [Geodermatophilus saharensis]|uniref:Transcriptional regulator, MarR family n=1 Tax=Geodermatophilus saharensis TaxID=1137994 RepID=A0A238ZJV2_9ACTN|nr:MarR family transcriptional regulator [Geodermatophilus saharensis]SNR82973.1 transcriptional regulator, MarR family [Geodermatophilus saharensis]
MPASPPRVAGTPAPHRAAEVRRLAEQFPRLIRLVHAFKSLPSAIDGRERAALVLLFPLTRLGPLRQSALAEVVHADPSTVSRHVASLVEQGLVQRVADENDGRASLLVVTDAGHAAVERLAEERTAQLGAMLTGWSDTDLATLTGLFGRLLDDLTAALPSDPRSPSAPPVPREQS